MNGILGRLARFAVERRGAVILIYVAISALLAWSGTRIRLETSLAELLPRGTASADDFRDYLESGGSLDRLLVSVRSENAATDTALLASAAEDLAGRLRGSGLVRDVRWEIGEEDLDRVSRFALEHLPVLIEAEKVDALAARITPEAIHESVAAIGRRAGMPGFVGPLEDLAARDPLGLLPLFGLQDRLGRSIARPDPESGLFLSKDGRRLLIVIEAFRPPTEIDFSRRLIAEVEAGEAAVRATPGSEALRFEHAGGHLFAVEDERRVRHDAAFTSLCSLAGVGFIYLFVVRRPALWAAILFPLVMATVWTLGFAAIYPGRLNMVTVAFAAILLGIGDDAMLHIYLREREERQAGLRAPESVVAALTASGPAAVVATLMTAVAFLSLALVRFRGLAELGLIGAMGMAALLAGVLLFFPAALAYLAERETRAPAPSVRLPLEAILSLHRRAAARRGPVLFVTALLTALMLWAAAGVGVSTDLRSIRGDDPAAEAMARLLAPFGESASSEMLVVIHGTGGDAAIERALEAAALLEPWCRDEIASGRITGCENPAVTMPATSIQRARFEEIAALPWVAAVATLGAEARAAGMNESFFAPFTEAALRYEDFESVRVPVEPARFGSLGAPQTAIFYRETAAAPIAGELRRRLTGYPTRIASVALVSADLSGILAEDYRRAGWIVAGVIFALTLAAFRRLRLSLLIILPVAFGCIWMLGTARLLGIELNLMSMMGMPVVFGLGVDFGVYVVDRWSRSGGDGGAALAGTGPAVLITGLTTLAGFAALLGADLAGLRSLGFTVVVGAGYSLVAALLILPLFLSSRGDGRIGQAPPPTPFTRRFDSTKL